MATSPMVKGNMGKFEVRIVCSNPEESSCLNACVLLRCESIVATPDPSLSLLIVDKYHFLLILLMVDKYHFLDKQRVSLGEFVDGR
jgi:hypothetical protein